jgi:hypothetical protein
MVTTLFRMLTPIALFTTRREGMGATHGARATGIVSVHIPSASFAPLNFIFFIANISPWFL